MAQAIQETARNRGCETVVYTTYRALEAEQAALRFAEQARFAGIIFTMIAYPKEVMKRADRSIPMVIIADRSEDLDTDTVELNNHNAGVLVAQHMAELGHRHIAYISTTLDKSNSARTQRLAGVIEGFRQVCPDGSVQVKSLDIPPDTELGNLSIEHVVGYELARGCFADEKITAFVAVNDMVAYGVIEAIHDAGLSVPEHYSVCGFDNIFPSHFSGISLTTVEHYMVDKGCNAFEILYAKINSAASDRNITRVEFKHHLIVRGSSAPPGGGGGTRGARNGK
jgi:LacI family transcriptional regulator